MMEDVLNTVTIEEPEEAPEEVPAASPEVEEKLLQEEVRGDLLEDPAVSGNEVYQQEVISLLSEMKGDLEDVKRSNARLLQESQHPGIYNSVSSDNVSDNITELVSSNIITKPLNDYTVSEALLLSEVVIILSIVLYLVIRKAVFKWR